MRHAATKARWRVAAVGALLALTVTGCADDPPPSESAPALGDRLDEVDAAIEEGELGNARKAVEDLIAETAQARVEGEISEEEADRIFDAARDVLAQLPKSKERDTEDRQDD